MVVQCGAASKWKKIFMTWKSDFCSCFNHLSIWINEVYWHKVVLVLNDNIKIHCLYVIIWAAISDDEKKGTQQRYEYMKETPTNYIKQETNIHFISCGNQCFLDPAISPFLRVEQCMSKHLKMIDTRAM